MLGVLQSRLMRVHELLSHITKGDGLDQGFLGVCLHGLGIGEALVKWVNTRTNLLIKRSGLFPGIR